MAALFTQLDADLVSNLVELASSPDCPDDELTIDETKYLDGSAQDCHVYASFEQGAWPASPDRQTWVREIVCRVGEGRIHESARSLWAMWSPSLAPTHTPCPAALRRSAARTRCSCAASRCNAWKIRRASLSVVTESPMTSAMSCGPKP